MYLSYMFPISHIVSIIVALSHISSSVRTPVRDSASGKPVMLYTVNRSRSRTQSGSSVKFFPNIKLPDHNSNCQHAKFERTETGVNNYVIDLQSRFEIQKLRILFKSLDSPVTRAHVKVYIHEKPCSINIVKNESLAKVYQLLELHCTNRSTSVLGQFVRIVSDLQIVLCEVKVLTCDLGRYGSFCENDCRSFCQSKCRCWQEGGKCSLTRNFCSSICSDLGYGEEECTKKKPHMTSKFINISREASVTKIIMGGVHRESYFKEVSVPKDSCFHFPITKIPSKVEDLLIKWKFDKYHWVAGLQAHFAYNVGVPSVLRITINDITCHTKMLDNVEDGMFKFMCQPMGSQGNEVTLNMTLFSDHMDRESGLVSICGVTLFSCHPSHYGPACQQPCRCLAMPCHPVTGACQGGHLSCQSGYRGHNCGSFDVLSRDVETEETNEPVEDVETETSMNGTKPAWYPASLAGIVGSSWTLKKTYLLPETFHLRNYSLLLDSKASTDVQYIGLYLDAHPENHDWENEEGNQSSLKGLPCWLQVSNTSTNPLFIDCPGKVRTITLVLFSKSPLSDAAVTRLQSFQCVDGTWGSNCQHTCNCKNSTEVCDKDTGRCESGCLGYDKSPGCGKPHTCQEDNCRFQCNDGQVMDARTATATGDDAGTCQNECLAGFMGPLCDQECSHGFFGAGCEHICYYCKKVNTSQSLMCDIISGSCTVGCKAEFLTSEDTGMADRCLVAERDIAGATDEPKDGLDLNWNHSMYVVVVTVTMGLVFILSVTIIASMGKKTSSTRYRSRSMDDSRENSQRRSGSFRRRFLDTYSYEDEDEDEAEDEDDVRAPPKFSCDERCRKKWRADIPELTPDLRPQASEKRMDKVAQWILRSDFTIPMHESITSIGPTCVDEAETSV